MSARENSKTASRAAPSAKAMKAHLTKISEAISTAPIARPMRVATMRSRPVRSLMRSFATSKSALARSTWLSTRSSGR